MQQTYHDICTVCSLPFDQLTPHLMIIHIYKSKDNFQSDEEAVFWVAHVTTTTITIIVIVVVVVIIIIIIIITIMITITITITTVQH